MPDIDTRGDDIEEMTLFIRALVGLPPGAREPRGWSVRAVTEERPWEELCAQAASEADELLRAAADIASRGDQDLGGPPPDRASGLQELLAHTHLLAPYMDAVLWRLSSASVSVDLVGPPAPSGVHAATVEVDFKRVADASVGGVEQLLDALGSACRELLASWELLRGLAGAPDLSAELCQRLLRFEMARAWVGYVGFRAWVALL